MSRRVLLGTLCFLMAAPLFGQQPSFESMLGKVDVQPVAAAGPTQIGFIFWGGDVPTFMANGGLVTKPDSIYGKMGLNIKLVPGDDYVAQVKDYLTGKTPYLRCTLGMGALSSEVVNKVAATKPVCVFQLTWSLGDHIVARESIKTLNDLKAKGKKKRVCLQQAGPHLVLLDDSLMAAGLKWDDIEVVWAKDLSGTPESPAEMFRKDPTIDACCVISPDMIGLCSDLKGVGTGAEQTVKGAHVVNSTSSMSHSIPDVYLARKDWITTHLDEAEKFMVGYLKATEELMALKKEYNDGKGKSPKYLEVLKLTQSIFGQKALPTIEVDTHGLVCDANFVRIPGNEIFFNDPSNLVGFAAKQTSVLELATKLGYVNTKMGFEKPNWDYKKVSEAVGVKYVQPVYATGRIKAEVTDFNKDLEGDTIFTFSIRFEPEQTTFPVESYAADFQRFAKASATFANSAIVIEGHSDPTLALQQFFWAAKAKGLITGNPGGYSFKGQPLKLTDTKAVMDAIQGENLAGQQRQDSRGNIVEIPDPRQTVAAALQLSLRRAEAVKEAIDVFAKAGGLKIDMSQAIPRGVGIANPVRPKPTNMAEAKENMIVVFRVVRVAAEAIKESDFNFEQ